MRKIFCKIHDIINYSIFLKIIELKPSFFINKTSDLCTEEIAAEKFSWKMSQSVTQCAQKVLDVQNDSKNEHK